MGIEVQSRTCQPSQTIRLAFREPLQHWTVMPTSPTTTTAIRTMPCRTWTS